MNTKTDINRTKSAALFEQAKTYFPGGVNSPVRAFKSVEGPPVFFNKGKGSHVWDVDGNEYIDFCCSWGPLILGHAHPMVNAAILETVANGTTFGVPTVQENDIAALVLKHNRYIEKIRFVSSGTEAVMSAIRLARGFTGKNKIVKFEGCYHGHVDALMVKAGSGLVTLGTSTSAGIPPGYINETLVLPLNDPELIEKVLKENSDVACVIIEPVPANNGLLLQQEATLRFLREVCTQHGVLLIFDEVISGFRVGFEGAAGRYDIQPDIITYGKIIGGGMPGGAYGASKEIMTCVAPDGPVYQAGTLSGNPVAMAAGRATLTELLKENFYENLEANTKWFTQMIGGYCESKGYEVTFPTIASIFWIAFSKKSIRSADQVAAGKMNQFKVLHKELLNHGVYIGPSGYEVGFLSAAHSDADLENAAQAMCDAMDVVFK